MYILLEHFSPVEKRAFIFYGGSGGGENRLSQGNSIFLSLQRVVHDVFSTLEVTMK